MSLKNLIKVADYYNVKYGFDKIASRTHDEIGNLFNEYDSVIFNIETTNLKYDTFPDYNEKIDEIFKGYLSRDDIQLLKEHAKNVAAARSDNYHGVSFLSQDMNREAVNRSGRQVRLLKNRLFGKTPDEVSPDFETRLKDYKKKRQDERAEDFYKQMEESGDFTDYDKYLELKGLPKPERVPPTDFKGWDL